MQLFYPIAFETVQFLDDVLSGGYCINWLDFEVFIEIQGIIYFLKIA